MNMNTGTTEKRKGSALQVRCGSPAKRYHPLAVALLFFVGWLMIAVQVFAATPGGPVIAHIANETYSGYGSGTSDGGDIAGGYIATLNLDAIQVNENWKGFVGNITGGLALADSHGNKLYNWSATIQGLVYVSRSQSITWSGLTCAKDANVSADEDWLNHTASNTDTTNISFTFGGGGQGKHPNFVAADIAFSANQCNYTLYTNLNSNPQDANQSLHGNFSEVILSSGTDIIYTTMINITTLGFDTSQYDYQIIVPENASMNGKPHSTIYYLFVELT